MAAAVARDSTLANVATHFVPSAGPESALVVRQLFSMLFFICKNWRYQLAMNTSSSLASEFM